MSDSLALSNKIATGDQLNIPRYYDLIHPEKAKTSEETPEQIISRFDSLRRR